MARWCDPRVVQTDDKFQKYRKMCLQVYKSAQTYGATVCYWMSAKHAETLVSEEENGSVVLSVTGITMRGNYLAEMQVIEGQQKRTKICETPVENMYEANMNPKENLMFDHEEG